MLCFSKFWKPSKRLKTRFRLWNRFHLWKNLLIWASHFVSKYHWLDFIYTELQGVVSHTSHAISKCWSKLMWIIWDRPVPLPVFQVWDKFFFFSRMTVGIRSVIGMISVWQSMRLCWYCPQLKVSKCLGPHN